MNNQKLLSLILVLMLSLNVIGQSKLKPQTSPFSNHSKHTKSIKKCYTNELEKMLQQKYPERDNQQAFEEKMKAVIARTQLLRTTNSDVIYRIPTIVHVVHNGEAVGTAPNITQAQVLSQFAVLNEDFRRTGSGFNDHPDGADILIEFYPALIDPDGNSLDEPGINRVNGNRATWNSMEDIDNTLKPSTIWDPEKYFNIWVTEFGGEMEETLGYAQFPSLTTIDDLPSDNGPASSDGVVIRHTTFGTTGTVQAPYNLGRTTTHEVGHWLGLRHIWGDGDCTVDDFCADTPNAAAPNYECVTTNSCTDDDANDMIENYMDYTPDACMNIFTNDQKTRMRTVMENSPRRKTLSMASCAEAETITTGDQSTTQGWYVYTADADQVVTISSLNLTTETTQLFVYSSCNSAVKSFSSNAFGTSQSYLSTYVSANETLYIYWIANTNEAFNWNLSISAPAAGVVCELASAATQGTNNLPATDLMTYWYEYDVSSSPSSISITTEQETFNVYNGSCDALSLVAAQVSSFETIATSSDDKLFVEFLPNGGNFNWSINETTIDAGTACITAVEAQMGNNSAPISSYWQYFPVTKPGKYIISAADGNNDSTTVSLYEGCNGDTLAVDFTITGEYGVSINIYAESDLMIHWGNLSSAFDWVLSYEKFDPGMSCNTAVEASEGINTAPQAPYWYYFTMPADGNATVSSLNLTDEDTYLIITDGCGSDFYLESDDEEQTTQSSITIDGLDQGDVLYIYWDDSYSSESFNWSITVSEPVLGEDCENAGAAIVGTQSVPATDAEIFYYTFTLTEEGKKIVINSSDEREVAIVTDCSIEEFVGYGVGSMVSADLTVGVEYLIIWETSDGGDFDWTLTIEDIEQGDSCSDPIPAVVGANNSSYAPIWFSYTMPKTADILISSENMTSEDTYLEIYEVCDGELVAENDDISDFSLQSELDFEEVPAGTTILIHWTSEYSSAAFAWELQLSNIENATPEIANQSFQIDAANAVTNAEIGTVVATDADGENLFFVITEDATGAFAIDETTGVITLADAALWDLTQKTITVSVSDDTETVSATITISATNVVVNNPPTITAQSFEIEADKAVDNAEIGTVIANDSDADALTFAITADATGAFAIGETTGVITLLDASSWDLSVATITISVTDGTETATATITITSLNSALSTEDMIEFELYPNPASVRVHIQLANELAIAKGAITNMSGQQIMTFYSNTINVAQLPAGIYLVETTLQSGEKLTKRLIIK